MPADDTLATWTPRPRALISPYFDLFRAVREQGSIDLYARRRYTARMPEPRFEWDAQKNATNIRKHGISFGEAITVFSDPFGLYIHDPDHSEEEERFLLLGLSTGLRMLVVCHCYQAGEHVIRVISARKADRQERATYGQRCHP